MASSHKKAKDLSNVHLETRRQPPNSQSQKTIHCFVELSKVGLDRCEEEIWLSNFLQRRKDGTGWIEGDFPKKISPSLLPFSSGLGKNKKVKQPPELIKVIRKQLRELLEKYQTE